MRTAPQCGTLGKYRKGCRCHKCKAFKKEHSAAYYRKNREHVLKITKINGVRWRKNNRERFLKTRREWYKRNRHRLVEKINEWHQKNKEHELRYRKANKDRISKSSREYFLKQKEKIYTQWRARRQNLPDYYVVALLRQDSPLGDWIYDEKELIECARLLIKLKRLIKLKNGHAE